MLAIRLDDSLTGWHGPVGMILGPQLYCDLSKSTEASLRSLVAMIQQHAPRPAQSRFAAQPRAKAGSHKDKPTAPLAPAPTCAPQSKTKATTASMVTLALECSQPTAAPLVRPVMPLRTRVQRIATALDLSQRDGMHLAQLLGRAEETLCMENDAHGHGAGAEQAALFCKRVARLELQLGLDGS